MRNIFFIIFLFLFCFIIGCGERPDDRLWWLDADEDGISDAVETNSANAHLGFDPYVPNVDPSIAHGLPNNGSLSGGINLPDNGSRYYHFRGNDPVDTDDWATLAAINTTEKASWKWTNVVIRFGVGDMSTQYGGTFPPHASHQNGLDIDFRYLRNDAQEIPLDISTADSIYYDPQITANLMNLLIETSGNTVTHIFVDTNYAHLTGSLLVHDTGHRNHFHIRIQDPDGTNNKPKFKKEGL